MARWLEEGGCVSDWGYWAYLSRVEVSPADEASGIPAMVQAVEKARQGCYEGFASSLFASEGVHWDHAYEYANARGTIPLPRTQPINPWAVHREAATAYGWSVTLSVPREETFRLMEFAIRQARYQEHRYRMDPREQGEHLNISELLQGLIRVGIPVMLLQEIENIADRAYRDRPRWYRPAPLPDPRRDYSGRGFETRGTMTGRYSFMGEMQQQINRQAARMGEFSYERLEEFVASRGPEPIQFRGCRIVADVHCPDDTIHVMQQRIPFRASHPRGVTFAEALRGPSYAEESIESVTVPPTAFYLGPQGQIGSRLLDSIDNFIQGLQRQVGRSVEPEILVSYRTYAELQKLMADMPGMRHGESDWSRKRRLEREKEKRAEEWKPTLVGEQFGDMLDTALQAFAEGAA